MTFKGSFERDVKEFAGRDQEFKSAVDIEDDDSVETLLQERFFHRPEMYYSADKLIISYGVPAPTPAFVYNALGKKPLPTKDQLVNDTVDYLSARFNLRYNEQQWLSATVQLITDDPAALRRLLRGDLTVFERSQFQHLGGVSALAQFEHRDAVFQALCNSTLVKQSRLRMQAL